MRFLVTGANGQAGSRLCGLLSGRGHEVTGTDLGPASALLGIEYRPCDLTREADARTLVDAVRPEVVVHTAAMTDVDGCERSPDLAHAVNALAPSYLARAARSIDAHLVHVSTDYVFDGEAGPYSETAVPNPRGVYATTKHMGEEAARVLAGSHAVCRTSVVYGWPPAGRPNHASWLVETLSKGQQVRLFADQVVSPSLAENLAAMLAEIGERRLGGIWNTCGAEAVDRVTFGKRVCAVFGFDPALVVPTRMSDAKLPSPRPRNSSLVPLKALTELAAKPLNLGEALKRLHASWNATKLAPSAAGRL